MRLVFFIDSLKKIGGGSYAQYRFALQLSRMGHDVTIFAGDRNFLTEDLENSDLKIFWRTSAPSRRLTAVWSRIHESVKIEPYIRKNRPDWLVGYMRISAIRATRLGAKYNIPVANFVFETPYWIQEVMGKDISGALAKSWDDARAAYANSNVLIPNSSLAGKELSKWLPGAKVSHPVYPGVEIPDLTNHNGVSRDIDIIYVGRLRAHKNVDILLRNARPEWKIAIIGSGDERENLEKLAADLGLQVDFMGAVTDEVKWKTLHRTKLMVFPSSFEGFGMPPLEAIASGCNILCSDIPIFREIYGDAVEYFDLSNPAITEQIEHLLNASAKTNDSLVEKYSWNNSGQKIESILKGSEY